MNRLFGGQPNLKGSLLVASPTEAALDYEQSVVFVVQDDDNGTFGVALNLSADEETVEKFHELAGVQTEHETDIVVGPLGGPVFAIHQAEDLAELEMPGGIYLSSQITTLHELMGQLDHPYRIVLGIVGWEKDEIRQEIAAGNWILMSASPEEIFADSDWIWERCLIRHGRETFLDVIGLEGLIDDPSVN